MVITLWYGVFLPYGMVYYLMVWYITLRYDVLSYGMVYYLMVWCIIIVGAIVMHIEGYDGPQDEGSTLSLLCMLGGGEDSATFEWSFVGYGLAKSTPVGYNQTYTKHNISRWDSGYYTCAAKLGLQSNKSSISVQVLWSDDGLPDMNENYLGDSNSTEEKTDTAERNNTGDIIDPGVTNIPLSASSMKPIGKGVDQNVPLKPNTIDTKKEHTNGKSKQENETLCFVACLLLIQLFLP